MIDLNTLKIVLFDFDDTLAIWENHKTTAEDFSYMRQVIDFGAETWSNCKPNAQMQKFLNMCIQKGVRVGLLSKTVSVLHMLGKAEWVKLNYGVDLENFCVSEMPMKVEMLKGIAEAYHYQPNEVALVDDLWEHTEKAANAGFCAYTPMEIVNFVDSLEN